MYYHKVEQSLQGSIYYHKVEQSLQGAMYYHKVENSLQGAMYYHKLEKSLKEAMYYQISSASDPDQNPFDPQHFGFKDQDPRGKVSNKNCKQKFGALKIQI